MGILKTFVFYELWVFLTLLMAIVGLKVLNGQINTSGLLRGKEGKGAGFSPGRAQLLITSLMGGLYYLSQVIVDPTRFPEVPKEILATVLGSQSVYLAGKVRAFKKQGSTP